MMIHDDTQMKTAYTIFTYLMCTGEFIRVQFALQGDVLFFQLFVVNIV